MGSCVSRESESTGQQVCVLSLQQMATFSRTDTTFIKLTFAVCPSVDANHYHILTENLWKSFGYLEILVWIM